MKKLLWLIALGIAGVYVHSAIVFSETGANGFLNDLEHLSIAGKGDEYCARLHEDLAVSIQDHSATPPADFSGGRREFCDYVSAASKGMDLLGVSTQVTRDDFTVKRSWLHPWTAQVSYREDRITTMTRVNVTLHTEGEDQLTLVQTLRGMKLLRLQSRTWLAD
jgi:hypothetical protein